MKKTRYITIAAMLLALDLVLSRFLVYMTPDYVKIGAQFIPPALSGIIFGPFISAGICMVSDLLGCTIQSWGQPIVPLITLTAGLRGLIFGLMLRKKQSQLMIFFAVLVVTLVVDLGLNPVIFHYSFGSPYLPTLIANLPIKLIMVPAYTFIIYNLWRVLRPEVDKILARG